MEEIESRVPGWCLAMTRAEARKLGRVGERLADALAGEDYETRIANLVELAIELDKQNTRFVRWFLADAVFKLAFLGAGAFMVLHAR